MKNAFAIIVVVTAIVLGGCAHTPPACDGSNRRPVNQPHQAGIHYPSCGQELASLGAI